MKFAQKHKKLTRVGSILNKLAKIVQRLLIFYHSGEILPNLVQLVVMV